MCQNPSQGRMYHKIKYELSEILSAVLSREGGCHNISNMVSKISLFYGIERVTRLRLSIMILVVTILPILCQELFQRDFIRYKVSQNEVHCVRNESSALCGGQVSQNNQSDILKNTK